MKCVCEPCHADATVTAVYVGLVMPVCGQHWPEPKSGDRITVSYQRLTFDSRDAAVRPFLPGDEDLWEVQETLMS